MKNLKANIALALGYWLIYCGIAQGGAFALSPWAALSGSPTSSGGGSGGDGGNQGTAPGGFRSGNIDPPYNPTGGPSVPTSYPVPTGTVTA